MRRSCFDVVSTTTAETMAGRGAATVDRAQRRAGVCVLATAKQGPLEAILTTDQFMARMQDYFGGRYTVAQAQEVNRWADKRDGKTLGVVYKYCTLNETTQYKTPPDIKALNRNLEEVYTSYPELLPESHNRQIAQDVPLLTEGEFADGSQLLRSVIDAMRQGRDPREDEHVRDIMARNGYSVSNG
jgi:hypothetical protein